MTSFLKDAPGFTVLLTHLTTVWKLVVTSVSTLLCLTIGEVAVDRGKVHGGQFSGAWLLRNQILLVCIANIYNIKLERKGSQGSRRLRATGPLLSSTSPSHWEDEHYEVLEESHFFKGIFPGLKCIWCKYQEPCCGQGLRSGCVYEALNI